MEQADDVAAGFSDPVDEMVHERRGGEGAGLETWD